MLTNTDLLFISEKITAIICSEILFTKNLYHIETNQFISTANQLSGFYHLRDFAERYFGTNYSYLIAIYSFFSPRSNYLRAMTEKLTLSRMVEIMRQIIPKNSE